MDDTDTPEQAALREAVRGFLRQHSGASAWPRLTGELGLTALAVPERHGGMGAGLAEVAVVVEETGRVLLPLPVLSTALAGAMLGAADAGQAAERFAPGIASGELRAAFVFTGQVGHASGRLSGTAPNVLDGAEADLFLVASGGALYAVRAADTTVTASWTLDQTRSQAAVGFRASPGLLVSTNAAHAEDLLRVMLAAECAAAAAHCLNVTVSYLKTRRQFGRPVGAFQALRHRCADLAAEVASARATARAAVAASADAASADAEPDRYGPGAELRVLAPLAKKYCADVFWHVAAEMIQLHGGIGFTWEHEAHLYLKRAKTTQLLHGTPGELRRLVAQRAGLP